MKKSVVIVAACICVGIVGCGSNAKVDTKADTTHKEKEVEEVIDEVITEVTKTTQEETSNVQEKEGQAAENQVLVAMEEYPLDVKAEDGTLLFRVSQNCPNVTIDGLSDVADQINDFYLKEKEVFDAKVETYANLARADYKKLSPEDKKNYQEYLTELEKDGKIEADIKLTYNLKRADMKCISVVKDSYEITSEYPYSFREATVFDASTGERLEFERIFEDEDKAKAFITDYLSKILRKKYKHLLSEDYEKEIEALLDGNTWYLSKGGVVVICNESVISPYAELTEITIPYSKFVDFSCQYQ